MTPPSLTRRGLLAAAGALGAGLASGCTAQRHISTDPDVLTLWYWTRSMSEKLLDVGRKQIPGTTRRLSTDAISNIDIKLRTSLAGGAYIPDITGLNSNVSIYFPSEDQFLDLNEFGAQSLKGEYFPWKWQFGVTPRNRFCFFPMDTGPTSLYYRWDLFDKAGLPSDPDALQRQVNTWDGYLETATQLKAKAGALMDVSAGQLYTQYLLATEDRYFSSDDKPIFTADGSTVRQAWEVATKAAKLGVVGKGFDSTSSNAAFANGTVAAHIEAVWWGPILKDAAPETKGKWRITAQPGRPGNSGGSFLGIPRTCKDPEAAFAFVKWLNTPENQVQTFTDVQLFPSSPASLESPRMALTDPFFDDLSLTKIFYEAAKNVPITYFSPLEVAVTSAFGDELTSVEVAGKDPEVAWRDALATARRNLAKRGVSA